MATLKLLEKTIEILSTLHLSEEEFHTCLLNLQKVREDLGKEEQFYSKQFIYFLLYEKAVNAGLLESDGDITIKWNKLSELYNDFTNSKHHSNKIKVSEDIDGFLNEYRYRNQLEILENMQKKGFNVVTCANCGEVILQETNNDDIKCPHCSNEYESSDCPDLYF